MTLAHTLDGAGPERVLMLHDWLGDSTTYDAAMPYFDLNALTVARVDLPGYGKSRGEKVEDLRTLDARVLAVADALGWERFHLVTHSMSTVIGQRLARSSPSRLASLTLITPVTPGSQTPEPIIGALRGLGLEPQRRQQALSRLWGSRLSTRWLELKAAQWIACSEPEAVALYVDLFSSPELPTIPAGDGLPVLAITGAHDSPPFQRAAVEAALRPIHSALVVEELASAGHYPMQETPPLLATTVEKFVREHSLNRK